MKTLAEKLSHYAYSLRYRDLPSGAVHEVKRRVIDSLGCALGAFPSETARIAIKVAQRVSGRPGATVLGAGFQTSAEMAAFANGTMIRYLDYNDTYLSKEPCHPSDNLAAALAIGEAVKASGRDVITAIALGYEVLCRLCDAASIRAHGWDHVTYGTISASLVAARLLRLSPKCIEHTLALAVTPNIALRQTRVGELSMWKGCAFANVARNGIFAALLAKEGMTGPAPLFEGEMGFWRQVSGPFRLGPLSNRKIPLKILHTSIKVYPAEYHAQSAIQAALELRKGLGNFAPEKIEHVEVETFKTAIQIIGGEKEKWSPKTRETADHSLPYCVAVALLDGKVGLEQFSNERINDPRLKHLLRRVSVRENRAFTRTYPQSNTNLVRVVTRDRRVSAKKVSHPKGHAKNPLTDQEVEQKFSTLASPLLSGRRISRILKDLWQLEKTDNVGKLLRLFTVGGPS